MSSASSLLMKFSAHAVCMYFVSILIVIFDSYFCKIFDLSRFYFRVDKLYNSEAKTA